MVSKKTITVVVFSGIVSIGILGILRYTDMIDNSDVISFLGSMLGAFIGVFGAIFGIYKTKEVDRREDIKKLIEMFKHTYIWVYPRYNLGAKGYENRFKEPIVPLIYDENWKSYITKLENSHHKRFLLNWFYTLDSLEKKVDFIPIVKEVQIKEAIKIIKYYNLYDNEVENMEKQVCSNKAQKIKKELIGNIAYEETINEARIASIEEEERLRYEQYGEQELYEEDQYMCTEEEIIDIEISKNISRFERLMISYESIYDFNINKSNKK